MQILLFVPILDVFIFKVCPTFGAPLIKRVLDNFVPDEFCPDPIPEDVLEALDSEVCDLRALFSEVYLSVKKSVIFCE